jgi:hypothetical protein
MEANCGSLFNLSANRSNQVAKKIMAVTSSKSEINATTAMATKARLFLQSISSGLVSADADGSDHKVIVSEGRRLPDGIVVDAEAWAT